MANAQLPDGIVALWPKSRGPLQDGQIVRLENGRLAEWFPVSPPYLESGSGPSDLEHIVPLKWYLPPKAVSSEGVSPEGALPETGWILWPKPDAQSLGEAMREAKNPEQKAKLLRGLSSLASRTLESPGSGLLLLDPETILAPPGWDSDISTPFKVFSFPQSSGNPASVNPEPGKSPQEDSNQEQKVRSWDSLLGKLADFWSEEGVHFLAIAHKLVSNPADVEIQVSADLRNWADRLSQVASKQNRRQRTLLFGGLVVFSLFVATIWGLGNWYRSLVKIRGLESNQRKEELLREEQAKLVAFQVRAMVDVLGGPASVLGPDERLRWRGWLRTSATFDKGDGSFPDLLYFRGVGHELLGEKEQAELLWNRLAGNKGPWAVRACLNLARTHSDRPYEEKNWLAQCDALLDDDDNSAETELLRAELLSAQAAFCQKSSKADEAEKLFEESRQQLWPFVEKTPGEGRVRLNAQALVALLPILKEEDQRLGKIRNLVDQSIANVPGFYPLVREKIRLLNEARFAAVNRGEASTIAQSLRRTIFESWSRFPDRKENLLPEIGSVLDAAMLSEPLNSEGSVEPGRGLELWALALAKMEEALAEHPRDQKYLTAMNRVWIVGGLIADKGANQLGLVIENYRKALATCDLMGRLAGPSTDLWLAQAQIHQELGWAAQRLGDSVLGQEHRKRTREIVSKVLKEFPGSVEALEVFVRLQETQIWDSIVSRNIPKARTSLEEINSQVLRFREGVDSGDRDRFQWVLMRRALLETLVDLSDGTKPDFQKINRWMGEVKAALAENKKEQRSKSMEYTEEMDRLRARWEALEALRLRRENASKEKVETQLSKVRVAQNKATWSDWERRNFDQLWLGTK